MELSLAKNIRALRKQCSLTQEQLAEILGVTTGAVYKWEAGMSVPELNLIVALADFFDTSVDALIGFQMNDNRQDALIQRLSDYSRNLDPAAFPEMEKALKKYPNSFDVVYACAELHLAYAAGNHNRDLLLRALDLLEKSRLLLAQNTNPRINDSTIYGDIASTYLLLGDHEKGLDFLRKNNAGGMFDDTIGIYTAIYLKRPNEARPFLEEAMLMGFQTLINSILGQMLVFCQLGDFESSYEILLWGIQIFEGLKQKDPGAELFAQVSSKTGYQDVDQISSKAGYQDVDQIPSKAGYQDVGQLSSKAGYQDKVSAVLFTLLAYAQLKTGRETEADESLRKARDAAVRFDAAPNYGINTLRFISVTRQDSAHDILGETARESIETLLNFLGDASFSSRWNDFWKEGFDHEG